MRKLNKEIINFFKEQGFIIVSTIDSYGRVHAACKGLVQISQNGKVHLLDLYRGVTFSNLKENPRISITAVDEHKFKGYCLKGRGWLETRIELSPSLLKAWEARITSRITRRVLKNLHEEKGHPHHPEAALPKPEYLIEMQVEEIVDLTPQHLKNKE